MREDEMERELDRALAGYGAVEPRDGLEQRVLANLRARDVRAARFAWGRWVAAGFAAASLASLMIWFGARSSSPDNVTPQRVTRESASTSAAVSAPVVNGDLSMVPAQDRSSRKVVIRARRNHTGKTATQTNVDATPRLAQFPAPEPLSEQEKLLVQYVEQAPLDAALVADGIHSEMQRELDEMKALNQKSELEQEP